MRGLWQLALIAAIVLAIPAFFYGPGLSAPPPGGARARRGPARHRARPAPRGHRQPAQQHADRRSSIWKCTAEGRPPWQASIRRVMSVVEVTALSPGARAPGALRSRPARPGRDRAVTRSAAPHEDLQAARAQRDDAADGIPPPLLPQRRRPQLLPDGRRARRCSARSRCGSSSPKALPPETPLDIVLPKTAAEFLVSGSAFAPGGEPVQTITTSRAPRRRDQAPRRRWATATSRTACPPQPAPFTEMPMGWDRVLWRAEVRRRTRSGAASTRCPSRASASASRCPTSCCPPARRARHAASRSTSAPIDIAWPQRQRLAGTHDQNWLEEDFPGFARDIDWRIFMAAQPGPALPWLPARRRGLRHHQHAPERARDHRPPAGHPAAHPDPAPRRRRARGRAAVADHGVVLPRAEAPGDDPSRPHRA